MGTRISKDDGRIRRAATAVIVAASVVAGTSIMGAGTANAASRYVECPQIARGAECGFTGTVGLGSWIISAVYRNAGGGYDRDVQVAWCNAVSCPVLSIRVANPERTPAGFEVSSDGLLTVADSWTKLP